VAPLPYTEPATSASVAGSIDCTLPLASTSRLRNQAGARSIGT